MVRSFASFVAVLTIALGLGPQSSEFCTTEGRSRVASCCCKSFRTDAAPHVTCCLPGDHPVASPGAPSGRGWLAAIGPAVGEPVARMTHDERTALEAPSRQRTTSADTGRLLSLRI